MKNDLALRGNINGVELLIFPSNQLPVNLQRKWRNSLYFLFNLHFCSISGATVHTL